MIEALTTGQEITETILNYRRDGSPFMNLLLIAPLYDNKGNVRYFLGCQIDVSSLIDEGRGLESFATLLSKQRSQSRYGDSLKKDPKHMLSEFGAALNEEEGNIIKNRTRSFSEEGVRPSSAMSGGGGSVRTPRRRLGMDDAASDRHLWPDTALGPSGRLPGVYQNVSIHRSIFRPCRHFADQSPTVFPRPPIPVPTHNIHITRAPHPRPPANEIPRPYRRSRERARRPTRVLRARHWRHG